VTKPSEISRYYSENPNQPYDIQGSNELVDGGDFMEVHKFCRKYRGGFRLKLVVLLVLWGIVPAVLGFYVLFSIKAACFAFQGSLTSHY
jgi:hypothetical protein